MTRPTDAPPPDETPAAILDLGLIHLPIGHEPANMQVPISNRPCRHDLAQRAFWAKLARAVDLTGPNGLVTVKPPGMFDRSPIERLEAGLAYLETQIAQRERANVLLDESKVKPLDLHRNVAAAMSEVTPQFFLRNIARLERDVDVRRLSTRHAVWRELPEEDLEAVRHPQLEPIPYVEELSVDTMRRLAAERHDAVLGFAWEEKVQGGFHHPVRFSPFASRGGERINVADLSLKPAPPNRADSAKAHGDTMRALAKRFDGSKGDEPAE